MPTRWTHPSRRLIRLGPPHVRAQVVPNRRGQLGTYGQLQRAASGIFGEQVGLVPGRPSASPHRRALLPRRRDEEVVHQPHCDQARAGGHEERRARRAARGRDERPDLRGEAAR